MSDATTEQWASSVPWVVTGGADESTGAAIRTRRLAIGMTIKELAEEAGVDRGRLSKMEDGEPVRATTRAAVERALDRIETEISGPYDAVDKKVVTFQIRGNFGVDVTLAGPVDNLEELEASVTRLIRSIGDQTVTPE